jgi:hypothetical protein
MSRYSLKPLAHRTDLFEVAVGWDPGLSTYFAIVFGVPEGDRDPAVLSWQGRAPGQLPTIAALESVLRGFAEIPLELLPCLVADKRTATSQPKRQFSEILSTMFGFR